MALIFPRKPYAGRGRSWNRHQLRVARQAARTAELLDGDLRQDAFKNPDAARRYIVYGGSYEQRKAEVKAESRPTAFDNLMGLA